MSRFLTSMVQGGLFIPLMIVMYFIAVDFHREGMERIKNDDLRQEMENDLRSA